MGRVMYGAGNAVAGNKSVNRPAVKAKAPVEDATLSESSSLFGSPVVAVFLLLGTLLLVGGIIWFSVQQRTRYDSAIGSVKSVNLTISDIQKQTDEENFVVTDDSNVAVQGVHEQVSDEEFGNTVAQIDRWHLVSTYTDQTGPHSVILDESYTDEEQAQSMVGQNRWVKLDLATYRPLHDSGINMLFAVPVILGLVIYIVMGLRYLKKS